jgi:large subunit ribosomal protein L13
MQTGSETYLATKADAIKGRKWQIVDADGKTLGRLASEIAMLLRGKHRPVYTPHVDTGDFVIVVNAEKVRVTGRKLTKKIYWRHSGYCSGLKSETLEQLMARHPERAIQYAVNGMLPKGRLGHALRTKLKVYVGGAHPHQAQQPEVYTPKYLPVEK